MINLVKVIACFHQLLHGDQARVTRNRGVSHPYNESPSHGLELLEPRLMLSATGLLPEVDSPGDAPPVAAIAITTGDLSRKVSHEHLVMHLKFDESVGTVAADSSPHGDDNKGSLTNGAFFTTDDLPRRGTVVLDGEDDYVGVNNSSNINLGVHAKRTVAVWFKIQDPSLSEHKQVIYEEGDRNRGLNIYVHDDILYVGGWNSPRRGWTGTYLSTDTIQSDTWHHVALVLNAEPGSKRVQGDSLIAYLDGFEFGRGQGSRLQKHPGRIGIGGTNGRTLLHDGVTSKRQRHSLAGQIADVCVYNRPLSRLEIAVLASDRKPSDPVELKFENRSIDGTGNNLDVPTQGAAETNLIRFGYPAVYPDGHGDIIEDIDQPNPRDVSNLINDQNESIVNDRHLTDWIVQWGQFLTHDISLTGNSAANNILSDGSTGDFSIAINDANDPLGPNAIPFNRSNFDPTTGTPDLVDSPFGPHPKWREQINSVTSYIDASNVYGSDETRQAILRSFVDGKLLMSEDGLLIKNTDGLDNDDPFHLGDALFLSGDIRANEQVGLTSVHTLFAREHNHLADLIQEQDPELTDEAIYQLARKIVSAEMQAITYNEFLPALLGVGAPGAQDAQYDDTVNASITNSFSTGMFRYGHSMQSSMLTLVDHDGQNIGSLSLSEAFFDPTILDDNPDNIDFILKGLATQTAQENDVHLVDDIRNFLFGPPGAGGLDLAALDIQRGRDHGLPDFNSLREFYELERIKGFDDITSDTEVQATLEKIYGHVDNLDAWVGGIAEDHLPGASVGETVHTVVVNQFTRLRDGDRFFYTNDPTLHTRLVRNVIDVNSITLADVICRNTGITNIQDNVFFEPGVLIHDATGHATDVVLTAQDDGKVLVQNRVGQTLDSRPIDELSEVILVGIDGGQRDRFVLNESLTSLSLSADIFIYGGEGHQDELVVRGGVARDTMVVNGNELAINGTRIRLDGIEQITIDLGGGKKNDFELINKGELEINFVKKRGGHKNGRHGWRR